MANSLDDFPIEFGDAESVDHNLVPEERWVKKYFSFLTDNYGFIYSDYCFKSESIQVHCQLGHKTPTIFIAKMSEPEFTKLELSRVIQYFEGVLPSHDVDLTTRSLEQNLRFFGKVFEKKASKIINEIDNWWLSAQVFQYKTLEEQYRNHPEDFLINYKKDYDYLRGKGVI